MGIEALGDLVINVGVDTKGLASGLDDAAAQVKRGASDMAGSLDGLSTGLDKVGTSATQGWMDLGGGSGVLASLQPALVDLGETLLKTGLAVEALSLPLQAAGLAAIKTAGEFEQAQVAMTTLLGSAGAAQTMIDQLIDFAMRTPFQIRDLLVTTRQLTAFGFEGDRIMPMLTSLGNAVSALGLGSEGLRRLTLAFGEMQARGFAGLREINQMARSGIPALDILGEKLGVTSGKLLSMLQHHEISAASAIEMLLSGFDQRFGGMMEKQSHTLLGMWSNVQDGVTKTLKAIGEALLPYAKMVVDFAFTALHAIQGLAEGFVTLPDPIKVFVLALAGMTAIAGPALLAIGGISLALGTVSAPVIAVTATLVLFVAGLTALGVWWETHTSLPGWFQEVAVAVGAMAAGFLLLNIDAVIAMFSSLIATLTTMVTSMGIAVGVSGGLATALALVGAATAGLIGWNLGKWLYENNEGFRKLGDELAGFLLKIPGAQALMRKLSGETNELAQAHNTEEFAIKKLEESLAKHGVTISRVGLSTEQYAAKLRETAKEYGPLDVSSQKHNKTLQEEEEANKHLYDAMKRIPFAEMSDAAALVALRIKAVADEHKKAGDAVVKFTEQLDKEREGLGAASQGMSDQQVVAASTQQALEQLVTSTSDLANEYDLLAPLIQDTTDLILEMAAPVNALGDAFEELGIKSVTDAQQGMASAEAAMAELKTQLDAGIISIGEYNQGLAVMAQRELDLAIAQGADAETIAALRQALDQANATVKDGTGAINTQKSAWDQLYDRVFSHKALLRDLAQAATKAFSDLAKGLADIIVDGGKFSDVLKQVGKDLLKAFIQIGVTAVTGFILQGLSKLFASLSDIDGLLGTIAGKLATVFGKMAGGIKTPGGGGTPSVPSTGGGGGGGVAGAVGGGLTGWISAIGSAVTAVSSVIGNFQTAHMNNTLNAMEQETARMAIYLGDQTGNSVQYYTGKAFEVLTYIQHRLEGPILGDLDSIKSSLWDIAKKAGAGAASVGASVQSFGAVSLPALVPAGAMAGGGTTSYNQITITDPNVVKLADQIVAHLRRNGLRL
jgi:tape measure domain-containing protein